MQTSCRLAGPKGADVNVVAIVGLQIVPGVGGEDACLGIRVAPVGADVENLAREARAGEVAADDGDGATDPQGAFAERVVGRAVHVGGVEEGQVGGGGGGVDLEGQEHGERTEDGGEFHDGWDVGGFSGGGCQ